MMKKLKQLIEKIEYQCIAGSMDVCVDAVVYDSRKITKGCLFLCIAGANADGHDFALDAVEKGARVLVTEKDIPMEGAEDVTVIRVKDTRYAMAYIAAAWFENPAKKMKVIGITGTKGKTTTTYLVKSILENSGHKVGLIGTIEVIIGEKRIHAVNTTPESYLLQEYLYQMAQEGCDAVVMEVSSQGLKLHRRSGYLPIWERIISGRTSMRILMNI